jgi:ribosome biogenesis GTPase
MDISFVDPVDLQYAFRDFKEHLNKCKYTSCLHNKESDCRIKEMVDKGVISEIRYNTYITLLTELLEYNRRNRK